MRLMIINSCVDGELHGLPFFNSFFSRMHATLHPALSVRPLIGRLVGWSVGHTSTFFINFIFLSHLKSFKSMLSHSKSF